MIILNSCVCPIRNPHTCKELHPILQYIPLVGNLPLGIQPLEKLLSSYDHPSRPAVTPVRHSQPPVATASANHKPRSLDVAAATAGDDCLLLVLSFAGGRGSKSIIIATDQRQRALTSASSFSSKLCSMDAFSETKMPPSQPIQAGSLSTVTKLADNPPLYVNPTAPVMPSLILYIVRVPGSQG